MPSPSEEEKYLTPKQRENLPYALKEAIINKKKGMSMTVMKKNKKYKKK